MHYGRKSFLTAGALLLAVAGAGCSGLSKEMVATGTVPPKLYTKMQAQSMRVENTVRAQYPVDFSSAEVLRLQEVVNRVQQHARRPDVHSKLGIIMNPGYVNSCTGGQNIFIGITLVRVLHDDDLLAAVFAHEIAHIDQFHGWRTLKRKQKKQWITLGVSNLMNVGLAFIPGGSAASLLTALAPRGISLMNNVTADIIYKGYTKQFEYAADYEGCRLLAAAGYDPHAELTALKKINTLKKNKQWLASLHVFSTHPATEKRIARLESTFFKGQ